MDERLSRQQVVAEIEGGVLGEAIADGDHEVGRDESLAGRGMAAVAEDAEPERMIFGDDALAVERGGERNLEALDERLQFRPGATAHRAEADQRDDRFVLAQCGGDRCRGGGDLRRNRQHRLHDELDVAIIVDGLAFERQILGHVDVDRPGAAFEGEIDRFLDDVAGLGNVVEEERALGGGGEHRLRVRRAAHARGLVQGAFALPDDARITGDRQDRIGIRHRHREPGEQVEAAGPGGGEAHAQAVGIDGVAAGHERGGLLMAHDHRPDLGGVLERNHGAGGVFAGAAKGGIDAYAFQRLDDRLVHTHRSRAPKPPEEYRDGSAIRLRPMGKRV